MKTTKRLFVNIGLAFVAGFVTTLGTLLNSTPKALDKSVVLSLLSAAVFAGVRAAVGFVALNLNKVPAIPVDE